MTILPFICQSLVWKAFPKHPSFIGIKNDLALIGVHQKVCTFEFSAMNPVEQLSPQIALTTMSCLFLKWCSGLAARMLVFSISKGDHFVAQELKSQEKNSGTIKNHFIVYFFVLSLCKILLLDQKLTSLTILYHVGLLFPS